MEKENVLSAKILKNKSFKGIIIAIITLIVIYLGLAIYFNNHFYFGTKINGISASGKTVEALDTEIASLYESYSLTLEERDNIEEIISSSDIGLKYDSQGKLEEIKNTQSTFGWIFGIFKSKNYEIADVISYDESVLNATLENLKAVTKEDIIEPKSATIQYIDGEYTILNEVYGNKIDPTSLREKVSEAILRGDETLNLDSSHCYVSPKYISTDDKVKEACDLLKKYVSTEIKYELGNDSEEVNSDIIKNWIYVDEDFNVLIDSNKVKKFVNTLSANYNTFGKTRSFTTSLGNTVTVEGGNYGWMINISKEVEAILDIIKEGQPVTREPIYVQTAASRSSNDIGNTYVEVNLTKQHLWFYKNGALVVEGDVVTGNVAQNTSTPAGTYKLNYKERESMLRGEGYNTLVHYWMPFNGGIGIHDAYWRDAFGGQIYLTEGSHGCVNAPPEVAATIFENIEAGTAIVCYTE